LGYDVVLTGSALLSRVPGVDRIPLLPPDVVSSAMQRERKTELKTNLVLEKIIKNK